MYGQLLLLLSGGLESVRPFARPDGGFVFGSMEALRLNYGRGRLPDLADGRECHGIGGIARMMGRRVDGLMAWMARPIAMCRLVSKIPAKKHTHNINGQPTH